MRSSPGFALTEVLVAIFILAVSTVAVTGLSMLGSRSSLESSRQTVALGLVNQRIEQIRGLPYGAVGFVQPKSGEPDGVLAHTEKVEQGQQSYTLTTTIKLVDDPANGKLTVPLTEDNADYKEVKAAADWKAASGAARDVSNTTYVANAAISCNPGDKAVCPPVASASGIECSPGSTCTGGAACPNSGICPASTNNLPACSDCSNGNCPQPSAAASVAPSTAPAQLDCPSTGICPTTDNAASSSTSNGSCPPGALYCNQCSSNADCASGLVCANGDCVESTTSPTPTPSSLACGSYCSCPSGQACDTDSQTCCTPGDPGCNPPCTNQQACPAGQTFDDKTCGCVDNTCAVTGCPACQTCNSTSGLCDTDPNCTPPSCDANTPPQSCPFGQTWDPAPNCLCQDATCVATGCPTCQTCNTDTGQCDTQPNCVPCDPASDPSCQACNNPNATVSCPQCQICDTNTGMCGSDPSCQDCTTTACPDGQVCIPDTGMCGGCSDSSQCPSDEVCTNGSCEQNCNTSGQDCQGNAVCNPDTGTCDAPQSCSDDSSCSSGLACIDGICQGPECESGSISVDCSLLQPEDPGCDCIAGGRFVTTKWIPVTQNNTDPYCNNTETVACIPNQVWTTCSCPTPTPGYCGDGTCNYGQETLCEGAGGYPDCPNDQGLEVCPNDCSVCGDGYCTGPEVDNQQNCPQDCTCGNGVCDPGEGGSTCPADCPTPTPTPSPSPVCGDGFCNAGEDAASCPCDCVGSSGDGVCNQCAGNENYVNDNYDCGYCGDDICGYNINTGVEDVNTCPADCAYPSPSPSSTPTPTPSATCDGTVNEDWSCHCGNGSCEGNLNEDEFTCSQDCQPSVEPSATCDGSQNEPWDCHCGNLVCEGNFTEDQFNCSDCTYTGQACGTDAPGCPPEGCDPPVDCPSGQVCSGDPGFCSY